MNTPVFELNEKGLRSVARRLLETMVAQYTLLEQLIHQFDEQVDALRAYDRVRLETAADRINHLTASVEGLQHTRGRRARLLARMLNMEPYAHDLGRLISGLSRSSASDVAERLSAALTRIHERSAEAQRKGREAAFTISFAIGIGREMIGMMRGGAASTPTYDATGQTCASSDEASLVNHMG